MCRLFGMSGGSSRVRATFWLLDAPDSLVAQSHANVDGTGLGIFDPDGSPVVYRTPMAAYEDIEFACKAREVESTTFVAHVRFASTGAASPENTHPFEQQGRLLAHQGVIRDLPALEHELGPSRSLVRGDTDSERFFALITREIERNDGDVYAGITSATRWVSQNLPVYAINIVLTTAAGVWALRYPETHELFVLERAAGGCLGGRRFDGSGEAGTVRVRSQQLRDIPAVVIASERMDEDTGWRLLEPGELLQVGPELEIRSEIAIPDPPEHQLTYGDLHPEEVASQHPEQLVA